MPYISTTNPKPHREVLRYYGPQSDQLQHGREGEGEAKAAEDGGGGDGIKIVYTLDEAALPAAAEERRIDFPSVLAREASQGGGYASIIRRPISPRIIISSSISGVDNNDDNCYYYNDDGAFLDPLPPPETNV